MSLEIAGGRLLTPFYGDTEKEKLKKDCFLNYYNLTLEA